VLSYEFNIRFGKTQEMYGVKQIHLKFYLQRFFFLVV